MSVRDSILYEAIGVERNSSVYEIRTAYLKIMDRSFESEKNDEHIELVKAAYKVLVNPDLRRIYDESGIAGLNKIFGDNESENNTNTNNVQNKDENNDSEKEKDVFVLSDSDSEEKEEIADENSGQNLQKETFNDDDDDETNNGNNKDKKIGEDEEVGEKSSKEIRTIRVELTLEQFYLGYKVPLTINIDVPCFHCNGTGNEFGTPHPKCKKCNGAGKVYITMFPNTSSAFTATQICEECLGRGEIESMYSLCGFCYGRKTQIETVETDIYVEPGTKNGKVYSGKDFTYTYRNFNKYPITNDDKKQFYKKLRNINVIVLQKPHPVFERIGYDLIYRKSINLTQSLCGFIKFSLKTIDGRTIVVKGEENVVIFPGSSFEIENEGFKINPKSRTNGERGRSEQKKRGKLIIVFKVEMPGAFDLHAKVLTEIEKIQPLPNIFTNELLSDQAEQKNSSININIRNQIFYIDLPL